MRTIAARRLVAVVAPIAVLAAACTFSLDERAQPVDDAPEGLLDPTTTTSTPPESEEETGYELVLMFVNTDDRRVPVTRMQDTPPTVQQMLDALAAPPQASEQEANVDNPIRTLIPASLEPADGGVEGGVLRVTVEGFELRDIATATPETLILIYSQIVCSAALLESQTIDFVEVFDDDGRINAVPEDPVAPVDRAVGPTDYRDCVTAADIAAAEAEADAQDQASEAGT